MAKMQEAGDEVWTLEALIDELSLHLMKIECQDEMNRCTRKYERRAGFLIYRIPVYIPTPVVVVNISDLSTRLKHELESLDDKNLNYAMKEALGRLFANEDENYYLPSVKRLLRWTFEA
jgi:hypothetical protein